MPVCGYYGPFAGIYGHHHYTYAFLFEQKWPLESQVAADEASSFYSFLRTPANRKNNFDHFVVNITNPTSDYNRP